jgi:hypothetical protein
MIRSTHALAFLSLATLSAGAVRAQASAAADASAWRVGAPLPALRLPTIDGASTIALSDLYGRKLLLVEFASW